MNISRSYCEKISAMCDISASADHTYVLSRERIGARFRGTLKKITMQIRQREWARCDLKAFTVPITAVNTVTERQLDKHQFRKDGRTGAKSQLGHLALEDFLFRRMKN